MNIAIVVADFNREITSVMERKAIATAKKLKISIVEVVHVPGSFEIPFAAKQLLKRKNIDGIVTLGAVVQGDTNHDIIIVQNVSRAIMELSLQYDKPISLGVIGPRVTWQQAKDRAEGYAERAVRAVVGMVKGV